MTLKLTTALALALGPLVAHADGLLAVNNPALNGQAAAAYASAEAFAGNDQLALRRYIDDWKGDYRSRAGSNIGVLAARAETGAQWRGFRLGLLYRAEALAEANQATSDLYQSYRQHASLDSGTTHALDYQLNGFAAHGARLSKSLALPLGDYGTAWQLSGGLGLSYLRGTRVRVTSATGQAVILGARNFDGTAQLDDSNSKLDIANPDRFNAPFGNMPSVSGRGYALDAGVALAHRDSGAALELAVADLAGRMDWKNLPNNLTEYTTDNEITGADGFVQFIPTIRRTSSYQELRQRLAHKWRLAGSYPVGPVSLRAETSCRGGYCLPQAGLQYRFSAMADVQTDYDVRFRTVGLALHYGWLSLAVRTKSTDLDKTRAFGVNGGLTIPF